MNRSRLLLLLSLVPFCIALVYLGVALSLDRMRPADPHKSVDIDPLADVRLYEKQLTTGETIRFYWPECLFGTLAAASVLVYLVVALVTWQAKYQRHYDRIEAADDGIPSLLATEISAESADDDVPRS